jgi:MFS-type transporter involved in bile tolerance (Atg22 family)
MLTFAFLGGTVAFQIVTPFLLRLFRQSATGTRAVFVIAAVIVAAVALPAALVDIRRYVPSLEAAA